jgi:[ribosomal protein S18]-alanine N-acetyltransferase
VKLESEMRADFDLAEVSVEPIRKRHLTQIMAIEQQCYPRPWTRSIFESEITQIHPESRWYLVARYRRRVVGYGGLWITGGPPPNSREAHVTNIAVDPTWRRRGLGELLMRHLAEHAISVGCEAWTLEVRASSQGAQAMYAKFGFVPAGVRRNYYENTTDAIVMWCHDIQAPTYAERISELGVQP